MIYKTSNTNPKQFLQALRYDKIIYWKDIKKHFSDKFGIELFKLIDNQFLYPKN